MEIEICQNNTNETGMYKIWFTNTMGQLDCRNHSEEDVFELLTDKQMDKFLCGESKFKVGRTLFNSLGINIS